MLRSFLQQAKLLLKMKTKTALTHLLSRNKLTGADSNTQIINTKSFLCCNEIEKNEQFCNTEIQGIKAFAIHDARSESD